MGLLAKTVKVIPAGGTYKASVSAATAATDNVNLAANDTVTTSKTINSLTITGDRVLTINPGVTLTIMCGLIVLDKQLRRRTMSTRLPRALCWPRRSNSLSKSPTSANA